MPRRAACFRSHGDHSAQGERIVFAKVVGFSVIGGIEGKGNHMERYNKKTTSCVALGSEFLVFAYRSILVVKKIRDAYKFQIRHGTSGADLGLAKSNREADSVVNKFRDAVNAFHSYSGVDAQLMNSDGTDLFEVDLFKRWILDNHEAGEHLE